MGSNGTKTKFSCEAVYYYLIVLKRQIRAARPEIFYSDLLDEAHKIGLKGGQPRIMANSLSLMNKFTSDVQKNKLFLPTVLVVSKENGKPTQGFYEEFGECLRGKEDGLLKILRDTSPQDWDRLIQVSKTLNVNDDYYRYVSQDHYISACPNT